MEALLKSQSVLPVDLFFCPAMDLKILGGWTPRFSNSETSPTRIGAAVKMEVRDSGFFKSEALAYGHSLHHLDRIGKVYVDTGGESNVRYVIFDDENPVPCSVSRKRSFWFSLVILTSLAETLGGGSK